MIPNRITGRTLGAVFATTLAFPAGAASASDVWSRPVITAASIAACAPGSLPIGLGCLRIGGGVEASMVVASVPAWRADLATPRVARLPGTGTVLSRPAVAARVSADVRLPTELGPLRAYVSIRNLPPRRADGF